MKKTLLVIPLLCLICLNTAPTARAAPNLAKTTETAATSRGLWLEFKLGSSVGYGGAVVLWSGAPAFMIGYKAGRLTVGAEVGVGYSSSQDHYGDEVYESRHVGFTVVPRFQYDVAYKGPVSIYFAGGVGLSLGWSEYPSTSVDLKSRSVGVVMHLGFGVRYYVHPRFALGVEVDAHGSHHRRKENTNSVDESKSWGAGLRGALTAAVVF